MSLKDPVVRRYADRLKEVSETAGRDAFLELLVEIREDTTLTAEQREMIHRFVVQDQAEIFRRLSASTLLGRGRDEGENPS